MRSSSSAAKTKPNWFPFEVIFHNDKKKKATADVAFKSIWTKQMTLFFFPFKII